MHISNSPDTTEIQVERQLPIKPVGGILNQHELTNQYRRLAAEFGKPACVEQQSIAEWLDDHERAEVCS